MTKQHSRYDFIDAADEVVLSGIRDIYSSEDLPLLADYPSIDTLKEWARTGFSDDYLIKKKFSRGLQELIKLSLKEKGILN